MEEGEEEEPVLSQTALFFYDTTLHIDTRFPRSHALRVPSRSHAGNASLASIHVINVGPNPLSNPKCTTHSPQIHFKLKSKSKQGLLHPPALITTRGKITKSSPSVPDLTVRFRDSREIYAIRRIRNQESINGRESFPKHPRADLIAFKKRP